MICSNCKHFFSVGRRPDGTPNGVGFVLEGGKEITLCANCLIELGKMSQDQQEAFFDSLTGDVQ